MDLSAKIHTHNSQALHEKYFKLLGESIIAGVWTYGDRELPLMHASYDVVRDLVQTMGVSCARYLKVLIPQLTFSITPRPYVNIPISTQISAVQVLQRIVSACSSRMQPWKGQIIAATVKCWVVNSELAASSSE